MFKKRLLGAILCVFIFSNAAIAHAQKIYLFTGGDIHDTKIGEAAREDIWMFAGLFSLFEPDKQVVYYNQTQLWTGPDIYYSNNYKEAILTAIRKCPATSSDKIVFYWSGHGAYDQKGHYLFMPKGRGPRQVMYRSEILNALKEKGASLTVLITDSCHVYHEMMKLAPAFNGYEEKCEGIPPLFRSLFFDCKGVVNINSSSPNETSSCTVNGSVFTTNFVACASDNQDKNWDWKSFLDDVQKSIREDRYSLFEQYNDKNLVNQNKTTFKQNVYAWGNLPPLSKLSPSPWKIVLREKNMDDFSPFEPIFEPLYFPKKGDRIISVKDTKIRNADHFNEVIRDADIFVMFTLIDSQTGKTMNLAMIINPPDSNARLGINIQDDPQGGVKITGVKSGMPGERCYILMDKPIDDEFKDLEFRGSTQPSYIRPEYGDRIIAVNNIKIRDAAHYSQIIRGADTRITFTLIDRRTGKAMNLMADLNPPGSNTRLGIYIHSDARGGVMVTGVIAGSPGEKCLKLKDDNIPIGVRDSSSSSYICPEYGDRIISVNNITIRDAAHYSQVIRDADTRITFTLIDRRTGKTMNLMADLNPPGSNTRLGIYIQSAARGGVMVTGVIPGSPGEKCLKLNN